jgi:hypothetical protein
MAPKGQNLLQLKTTAIQRYSSTFTKHLCSVRAILKHLEYLLFPVPEVNQHDAIIVWMKVMSYGCSHDQGPYGFYCDTV